MNAREPAFVPASRSARLRKLEQRGIAGVCIEDKQFPKTNSFINGEAQPLADIDSSAARSRQAKTRSPMNISRSSRGSKRYANASTSTACWKALPN